MGWGGGTIPVLEAKATMATVDTARSTAMTASAQRRDFMYIGSPGGGEGTTRRHVRRRPCQPRSPTYTPASHPPEWPPPRPRHQEKHG